MILLLLLGEGDDIRTGRGLWKEKDSVLDSIFINMTNTKIKEFSTLILSMITFFLLFLLLFHLFIVSSSIILTLIGIVFFLCFCVLRCCYSGEDRAAGQTMGYCYKFPVCRPSPHILKFSTANTKTTSKAQVFKK